ncbi:hypothetical protein H1230_26595 [Paenibacillus sp. 19GGS1-52]|uniref:carboxypeptidase-like regulatory domain-containing protein n=1 Tax=Paenibacillus sp. 19GGS1-52 TaxID=2758563 RepID=UPI001EFAC777|nr:carboxypeptidase-like regulatory domain-containing protein [Paenibacillus sp. 19GGS1-52]ULO06533.1 hypothetical protein H1230_26595 [Paenibacillus sp. 19GGS1-52]
MTINFKVKHLILFVLIPASLLFILMTYVPSLLNLSEPTSTSPSTARAAFLQKLDSTSGSKRMELIRKNVIDAGTNYAAYRFDVYIGSTMSNWSNAEEDSVRLLPEDRIVVLEEYIREGPADNTLVSAAQQLTYEYDALNRKADGTQALITAENRFGSHSYPAKVLALSLAERALNRGDLPAAEVILDQPNYPAIDNQSELDARKAWLKGRLLFAKARTKEALTVVSTGLASYEKSLNDSKAVSLDAGDTALVAQLKALLLTIHSAIDTGYAAPTTVSGTLMRSDGTPIPRAGVFLRAEHMIYRSISKDEPYRIITDEQGHFQFSGITPGFYQLQLGLSFEQIDGWTWPLQADDWIEVKQGAAVNSNIILQPLLELQSPVNQETISGQTVDFRWKSVKGAAYYNLNGNIWSGESSFGGQLRGHITDNYVSIPVDEMYYHPGGLSFGSSGDWQSVDPLSLLGYMNPDNRFSWSVEAMDSQGRLITRSNGYRLNEESVGNLPFFFLKERTLTVADQLLLDKKLDQAWAAYRKDYTGNPQDVHALFMLINMMNAKASIMEDPQIEAATIPLLQKLVQLYPSSWNASMLAFYFYKQSNWELYNQYYSLYLQLNGQPPNSYDRSINANALLHQLQLEEARKQFAIAMKEDDTHRFIGSYLAAELYDGKDLSSVLELAKLYPEHSYGHSGNRWPNLMEKLMIERAVEPKAFDRQLKEKLGWYVQGQTNALELWVKEVDSSALKEFMKAVLAVS